MMKSICQEAFSGFHGAARYLCRKVKVLKVDVLLMPSRKENRNLSKEFKRANMVEC